MWKMIRKQIITFARTSFTLGTILVFILYTLHLQQRQPPFVKIKIQSNESKVNRTTCQEKYVINTPLCKILRVNLTTREFKQKYYWNVQKDKCEKKPLAVIENQNLKLLRNKDAFQNCCYREVERGQLTRSDDLHFSDWLIKTSTTCSPIPSKGMKTSSSFIRIECNPKGNSLNDSIGSRENHVDFASVVLPPQNHSLKTRSKTRYWDERRKDASTEITPSILMIGIDGVSRLNMQRYLPKTRNYAMQNGFIEFKGFTTMHGTDSFRNIMAMLTGQVNPSCKLDSSIPLDNCPFIWKKFSSSQYITAIVEDSAPDLSIFNENRRGFLNQPVDYTLRTLMVAAQTYLYEIKQQASGGKMPCLNGKNSVETETSLKYIQDFVKIVGGSYPYFLISLFRTLTKHNGDYFNDLRKSDIKFLNLLENILETSKDGNGFDAIDNRNVNDTVIILYSTHGKVFPYLYAENSFESSHEAALPILLVRLPPNLKNNYPEWYRNLQTNSERLVSAFDIHETLRHFQSIVASKLFHPHLVSNLSSIEKRLIIKKQSSYSLIKEIPLDRTCGGAKIDEHFCQCNKNHSTHGLTDVSNSEFSRNWDTTGFGVKLMMTKNLSIYRDWALVKTRELIKNELARYRFALPNNSTWGNYVLETGREPIRTLIATTWGSGSTVLEEILESHPGTYYHFEPLIKYNMSELNDHSGKIGTNVLKHLFNCNLQHLAGYWSRISSDRWFFRQNTRLYSFCKIVPEVCWNEQFLDRMCSLFPFQTAKTVRLRLRFARRLLKDPKLKVRIIYLVRDPRGTMQSRLQLPWCTDSHGCINQAFLCKDLVDDYHEAAKLRKKFPHQFLVVRYEDIASDIHAAVKKILAFSRMEYHPTIQSFLDKHTKTFKKDAHGTYQNTKANPFRWIHDVRTMRSNFTMVETIQRTCEEAMQLWGYKIARKSAELLDFNFNPIMKPPWPDMILASK